MNRSRLNRRLATRLVGLAAWAALALPAAAQSPRAYAVVSQLARDVSVVVANPAIGSMLGNNSVSRIPIAQGLLDKFVLNTTRNVLAQQAKGSRVFLVSPLDEDLVPGLQSVKEGSRVEIPADALEAFKSQGSTHLIIFSRHRSEASLRFLDGRGGTGSLEGMGFYVDRSVIVTNTDTRQTGRGYIAPYLHARASLIDVASGRVLRTLEIRDSLTVANTRDDAASTDVWDSLPPAEKVRKLLELLDQHVEPSVKALLAPA